MAKAAENTLMYVFSDHRVRICSHTYMHAKLHNMR